MLLGQFAVGAGLLLQRRFEIWIGCLCRHPGKVGRVLQILGNQLHDTLPARDMFRSTMKRSCHLEKSTASIPKRDHQGSAKEPVPA